MENLYVVIHILSVAALLAVSGMRPEVTDISWFELNRRAGNGDKEAKQKLERQNKLHDIFSLQRVTIALLLVVVSFVGLLAYQLGWGLVIALALALEAGAISRLRPLQAITHKLYLKLEPVLLRFINKNPLFFKLIRNVYPIPQDSSLNSREELVYLVEESGDVLSEDEKNLIQSSLNFQDKFVNEAMIPKGVVDTISKSEVLGPLVLDDLHKKGHSHYPVINKDIDHVVGILHVQDLLVLTANSKSLKVEGIMEKKVYYIDQNKGLDYALAAFLKTKHHLFIVVNEFRETVGILALEDVIETLIGKNIVDQFDNYDDLRVVAGKNLRANNTPKSGTDV